MTWHWFVIFQCIRQEVEIRFELSNVFSSSNIKLLSSFSGRNSLSRTLSFPSPNQSSKWEVFNYCYLFCRDLKKRTWRDTNDRRHFTIYWKVFLIRFVYLRLLHLNLCRSAHLYLNQKPNLFNKFSSRRVEHFVFSSSRSRSTENLKANSTRSLIKPIDCKSTKTFEEDRISRAQRHVQKLSSRLSKGIPMLSDSKLFISQPFTHLVQCRRKRDENLS